MSICLPRREFLATLGGDQFAPPKSRWGRSCLARPAQIRTCSFPGYGSHLG
jgi:hypothetical protein